MKFLPYFAAILTVAVCQDISYSKFKLAEEKIKELIRENTSRIGGFVRLAFHDCVGQDGCDGCINHNEPDNKGLKTYTDALDGAYRNFSRDISRSDFYKLGAILALEEATVGQTDRFDRSGFQLGRKDCETSPAEDPDKTGHFPSTTLQYDEVVLFFKNEFNLSPRASTALLGAHTLGRARQINSGHEGPWVTGGENVLDHRYYTEMIDKPWVSVRNAQLAPKAQWQLPGPTGRVRNLPGSVNSNMFFDADICLAIDFNVDENGIADCELCVGPGPGPAARQCCGPSAGFEDVDDFKQSNEVWLNEFTDAFFQMINKVNDDVVLKDPPSEGDETTEAPTEAPTQAPTEAPTQAPTEAPTQAPTEAPTQAPTEAPTQAPRVRVTPRRGGNSRRQNRRNGRRNGKRNQAKREQEGKREEKIANKELMKKLEEINNDFEEVKRALNGN